MQFQICIRGPMPFSMSTKWGTDVETGGQTSGALLDDPHTEKWSPNSFRLLFSAFPEGKKREIPSFFKSSRSIRKGSERAGPFEVVTRQMQRVEGSQGYCEARFFVGGRTAGTTTGGKSGLYCYLCLFLQGTSFEEFRRFLISTEQSKGEKRTCWFQGGGGGVFD